MLTFRKFVDAFIVKLFISLLLSWLILVEQSYGYDLYEGDNCELNNGKVGVCVKITECTSVLNNLKLKKIKFNNLVHCSFIGSVQVICCDDRNSSQIRKIFTSTQIPDQIVFINPLDQLETEIKRSTTPRLNTNFQDLSLSIYQQSSTTPRTNTLENYDIVYMTPVVNNIVINSNPSLNNNNAADDKTRQLNPNLFIDHSLNAPQTTKKPKLDSWMLNALQEKEEAIFRKPPKEINNNIFEYPRDVTVPTIKTSIDSNWMSNKLQSKEEVTTQKVLNNPQNNIFENQNKAIISTTRGPVLDDWMLNALKAKEENEIGNISNEQNSIIFKNPRQSAISTTSTPVLKTTTQTIESTTQKFNFGGNPFLTKFFITQPPLITNTHFPILDLWTINASKDLTTRRNSQTHESIKFPIWNINSDNVNDITRKPTQFNPDPTPVSRIGRKSVIACEQYSALAGPSLTFHILDGVPAALGEFPHMAALGYPSISSNEISWDCGGSLISEQYVLTAGHCLTRAGPQVSVVRLGAISLNGNVQSDARPIDAGIGKIILHPSYTPSRQYNDIALIQLDRVIPFDDFIRPACLHTNLADVGSNERLIATGWGAVSTRTRAKSNFLLQANLTSISLTSCNQSHVDYGLNRRYPSGLDQGQMCAFDIDTKDSKRDACEGDSGGPLQMKNADNVYTIVGVISFGLGCGTQIPGVYARVAYYLEWIESIVW